MSPQPAVEESKAIEVLSGKDLPGERLVVRADNGWAYEILQLSSTLLKFALAQAGASLLRVLGIFAADIHWLRISPELIRQSRMHGGRQPQELTAVAAALPVDPGRQPLWPTLPAEAAGALVNGDDLLGVAIVDVWTGCRQPHRRWYCKQGPWWLCTTAGEELLVPVLESASGRSHTGDDWLAEELGGFGAKDVERWVQRIQQLPEQALTSVLQPLANAGQGAGGLSPIAAFIQETLLERRRKLQEAVMQILGPKLTSARTEVANQSSRRPSSLKCRS